MVGSPSRDPEEAPPKTVAVPSGLSAAYRSALLEALSALGLASGVGGEAHGRVREALQTLERLDQQVRGSAAMRTGTGRRASHEMLEAAEKKAEQAERDLAEKRVPYEADPLFMYLWNRGFGTGAYRANSFVRYFDRKVARLVGYQGARANYATLLELPIRIREHAERLRAALGHDGPASEGAAPLLSRDIAAQYRTAVQDSDKAYADARLSLPGRASRETEAPRSTQLATNPVENERIAAAERALGEARMALVAKLTG